MYNTALPYMLNTECFVRGPGRDIQAINGCLTPHLDCDATSSEIVTSKTVTTYLIKNEEGAKPDGLRALTLSYVNSY
jgi:hypothetical protein